MRMWVALVALGCGQPPQPEPAPQVLVDVPSVAPVPVLEGPSRAEVLAEIAKESQVRATVLQGGWTRVGTHLQERVIKPVCQGEVPRLGVALKEARIHAFDGRQMVVHDIVGIVSAGEAAWTLWLAQVGAQRPVHRIRVDRIDLVTSRWRGQGAGLDWADGAEWVRDAAVGALVRVEQLDCRPALR